MNVRLFYRDTPGLQVIDRNPGFVAFKMEDQDFALSELSDAAQWIRYVQYFQAAAQSTLADF